MRRAKKLAALAAGLCCLVLAALAGSASASNPSVFASVTQPIGVAAAPGQLIVSEYCTGDLDSITDTGVVSHFASIHGYPVGTCIEMYLAISPGLGGFAPNDIYVTQGNLVWKIPPSGSPVPSSPFVTLPADPSGNACGTGTHSGITFDEVGTFGFDMIVTCNNGDVWKVDNLGNPTFVASTGTFLEGPAIPPLSFGALGGQILAADENSGNVFAISNSGAVTTPFPFTVTGAESVHVVPPNPCSFGASNGALFSAMYQDNAIWKWPPSDLSGLGGDILVTSEGGGGIALVTPSGGSYVMSQFSSETNQHEGSALVDCAVPPPSPTGIIAPTQTTCQDYTGGTAQTLGQVNYSVVGGKIGQGINPGVFFYYTKITTTTVNQVVTVSQSNTSTNNTPLFGILNGQAWLYPADCSSHTSGTVTGPNGSGASYTIPTPGTYIIGIKYQTKTIAGAPAPLPADITYKFTTSLGGSTGASVLLKKH